MKTQYYTASSLDGFIATTDHSLDWLLQFEIENTSYNDFIAEVGALAMGSSTYEWLLREMKDEPWPYPMPSWVFSSRKLQPMPNADIRLVQGDVRPVHRQMVEAAQGKNVWIVGGGDLVGQFYDAGLLDELIVQITSVTLGSGQPLLPRRIAKPNLKLISVEKWGEAFAELRYEVPKP